MMWNAVMLSRVARCALIGLMGTLVITTHSLAADNDFTGYSRRGANCVDSCILGLAEKIGRTVSEEDLNAAVQQAGLKPSAGFRSLADCQKLLKVLGIVVHAIPFVIDSQSQYPPASIIFIPASDAALPGHVVLVTTTDGCELQVFDPMSKPPVTRTKSSAISGSINTIALVPSESFFSFLASQALFATVASVLIGAGAAISVMQFRRLWRIDRRTTTMAPVFCLAVAGVVGCQESPRNLGVVISKTMHDFGVLHDDNGSIATHKFHVENQSPKVVTVIARSTSCSCTVADMGSQGLSILAGESADIAVSVRLANKIGPFEENVILAFEPAGNVEDSTRILRVKGFMAKEPQPDTNRLQFRVLEGRAETRELKVVYALRPGEVSSRLKEVDLEGSGVSSFVLGTPRCVDEILQNGSPCDVWRFPITYRQSTVEGQVDATLHIGWEYPNLEQRVSLSGTKLSAIEIPGAGKWYVSKVSAGVSRSENIPIRIHDTNAVRSIAISSQSGQVQGTIDVKTRRLVLSFVVVDSGDFRIPVELTLDGSTVCAFDVIGTAR